MKPFIRNLFLVFGIVALAVMIYGFPDGWATVQANRRGILVFLPAIIIVWALVFALNSWAFQLLVNASDHDKHLSFRHSFKLTVSANSFSATTPLGFGGGPYRVMELAQYIGTPRSISSVALYSMMHILSFFMTWAIGFIVFVVFHYPLMSGFLWTLLFIYFTVFLGVIVFFNYSYKYGILCKLFQLFFFIPFLKGPCKRFYERNYEAFQMSDESIRLLYNHPRQLWGSLAIEIVSRVLISLEFYFILLAFGINGANLADALIILCFSSLVGNVLYLTPLQIGACEGSVAVILPFLFPATTVGIGIFVSIFTRIREIFWVLIGVVLLKVGNSRIMK